MRSSKSVISAMLGIAFLAMPITAAAHPKDNARRSNPAPAFHPAAARAFRPAPPAPRFNPPPRNFARPDPPMKVAAQNRWNRPLPPVPNNWKPAPPDYRHPIPPGPAEPYRRPLPPEPGRVGWNHVPPPAQPGWVPPGHRRDYMWNPGHHEPDRDDFRTVCDSDGDNCRQVPYQPSYTPPPRYGYESPRPAYAPAYRDYDDVPYVCDEDGDACRPNPSYDGSYSDVYGSNSQYDYTPMAGESLIAYRARLIAVRDNAQARYRTALIRHDKRQARALNAWLRDLNKRIYNLDRRIAAQGGGYSYSPLASIGSYSGAYANPYANSYGPYSYGSTGMYSAVAPLLGNFIP